MFLSLRGVEFCLREWYHEETDDEIENTAWGGVLREIESKFDERDQPAVLSNLDYLREKRNGIVHPDDSPAWHETEDTLFTVRRTIIEIHDELN